ncbi:uncharacterized protein PHACADRAFT_209808 [Phanerochaete carnosa HHB-10118-sp]|uniref:DUF6535 domain-containing protein n=1 Tax=Phanerochaete carnosa (strain HHB-10118-sp) TaxID=650164 RepID=K5UVD6_PHACS|nr:uncharacterized protein PHACADRAFT_209808 [Phanerochaete carnosa HHB-10118-sp]EKM53976.1 hypothetical protein PHACADRAFT_209808 [Phanerochaete carnosa HHB-10118-sp]
MDIENDNTVDVRDTAPSCGCMPGGIGEVVVKESTPGIDGATIEEPSRDAEPVSMTKVYPNPLESKSPAAGESEVPLPSDDALVSAGSERNNPPREEPKRQDSSQQETKSAWTFLLDSAQEYDQDKIGKWRGEMDNLLVFAGLFSAVVTGFTVESMSWLQEDPTDTTNRLLVQMSAQMASFSVSPGYINSTAAPASSQILSSSTFQPAGIDVTINMLWFLSLTLSLLAAFFAIAVQQWLRALPLPHHLPVMESIQLWECRTEDLIRWQLPNVIILLPVTLQLSVVLFLAGLYHLLRTLSHPMTTAYAVVAGVPFCLYALSLPLPLIRPHCPYKSPLVPSVVFFLRWCTLFLLLLAIFLVLLPSIIIQIVVLACRGLADSNIHLIRIYQTAVWAVDILFRHFYDVLESDRDFWTKREHALLQLLALLQWLSFYFETRQTNLELADDRSPIGVNILARVNRAFAETYTQLLLDVLPDEWHSQDWVRFDQDVARILILLTWIYKADFAGFNLRHILSPLLIQVCESQKLEVIQKFTDYDQVRHPTVCLFVATIQDHYVFSTTEIEQMISLATRRIPQLVEMNQRLDDDYIIHTVDMILGAVAAPLHVLSRDGDTTYDKPEGLHHLLEEFDHFLVAQRQGIQYMAKLSLEQPEQVLMITRGAMKSVVDSLLKLAQRSWLPVEVSGPLVHNLVQTCKDQRALEDTMPSLDRLSELVSTPATAASAPSMLNPDITTDEPKLETSSVALPTLLSDDQSGPQTAAGGGHLEAERLLEQSAASIPMQTRHSSRLSLTEGLEAGEPTQTVTSQLGVAPPHPLESAG